MAVFSILDILVVFLDLIVAVNALRQKKWEGKYLGGMMLLSAGVNISYLVSILVKDYFWMSLSNGVYFSCITVLLMFLMQYIIRYIHFEQKISHRYLFQLMRAYAVFDVIVQMLNPFWEISMHYITVEQSVTRWVFAPKLLYDMHLGFSYLLLAYIVILLIWKICITPSVYRAKYVSVLAGIVMVVALNGAFLFLYKSEVLDISILFYIGIGFYLYWNTFHYSERGMLNKVRQMIIEEVGQPMVLFDDRNLLTMHNKAVERLFPGSYQQGEYTLHQFWEKADFNPELEQIQNDTSFQYNTPDKRNVYRCDFNILRDKKGRIIGRLLLMIDKSMEMDVLTGFRAKQTFLRHFAEDSKEELPAGIAIYDINRLADLNHKAGEIMGDRAIRLLADVMRAQYPKECYFGRLDDANLCVVCPHTELKQMRSYTANVREAIEASGFERHFEVQCVINIATRNILESTEIAAKSMRSKKLLDKTSAHSSLLDSLVQTQQEGDDATEEHVMRTRIMGKKLGVRLGLTDIQLSNLELLCLLHDIGKVGVPLEILNKPSKLNDAEGVVMRSHAEKGYRIAKASPELEDIAVLILHHHECWDGGGYPDGLKQEGIPLLSRIIAILDSYDAMTNDRPYRKAMAKAQARKEMKRCAGTQFDPYIVSEFLQMLEEEDPLSEEEINEVTRIQMLPKGLERVPETVQSNEYIKEVVYTKYILDMDCNILKVDENFEAMTGYQEKDVLEYHLTQWDLIYQGELMAYQSKVFNLLLQKQEAYMEHRIRRKDGSPRFVFCYGKQYYSPAAGTTQVEIIVSDISETAAMRRLLEDRQRNLNRDTKLWINQIRQDPLTKLLNREAYKNDVEMYLLKESNMLLFAMIDVDYFKKYNDSYGHIQGDYLLVEVAKELAVITKGHGIAGRLGGDEFSITIFLEKNTSPQEIQEYAHMLHREISDALAAYDREVTISMGATISNEEHHSFHDLYQTVDKALYQSKAAGKNQCALQM